MIDPFLFNLAVSPQFWGNVSWHNSFILPAQATILINSVDDIYGVAIALLLPITATSLVVQKNPYYALVLRGIVGAVAALVYALFGAADVALTEALVGTMLSITLYAIAVRSSLSMRLGVLVSSELDHRKSLEMLTNILRQSLQHHHLRLELVPYHSVTALHTALEQKEVHSVAFLADLVDYNEKPVLSLYEVRTRVLRLHSLFSQLPEDVVHPVYVSIPGTVVTPPQVSTQSIFEQSDVEQIKGG